MSAPRVREVVREATRDDLPTLVALEELSFPTPWSTESLVRQLAGPDRLTLVDRDGHCYGAFQILAADEAELLRLATHPDHRGRGLGRSLLAAGLENLATRGITRCHLEVFATNAPALALYRGLAFEEVGRRPRYYRDGSDAILLTRVTSR